MALALAMVMVLAMAIPAMAETVTNATDHPYAAYQVFSGTQTDTAGDTKLGDIAWGNGISSAAFLTALQGDARFNVGSPATNAFAECETAQDVAEVLGEYEDNSDFAKAFANVANANKTGSGTALAAGATSITLDPGYYLFVDTQSPLDDNDAYNSALLQITNKEGGLTIAKKYDVPSLDKDITKVNNTAVEVEAADVNIGDTVQYTLTGTLPSNYADYETYKYVFHDTISKGQAVDFDSFKVTLDTASGTDITSLFTNSLTADTDGSAATTFTLTCANLKTNTNITATSKIIVTYTATLTADAVIGSAGNSNTGKLEYSNNPNQTGDGTPTTSETPEDGNLVFTYDLNPTKVDGENNSTTLPNAQFVLKATSGDHNGKYAQIDAATKKLTGWLDTKPTALDTVPTTGNTGVLVSGSDGQFEVYGLDSGTYELEEIKAPKGYNILTEAIPLTITAEVDGDETTGPKLDSLTITVDDVVSEDLKATGILPVTIENNSGSVLPSTGGIGTTMFYVIGAILVLGAGIVMVSKRRMDAE